MSFRDIAESIVSFIFPNKCAACGEVCTTSQAICDACLAKYAEDVKKPCPVCGKRADSCGCVGGEIPVCLAFYRGYYSEGAGVLEKLIFSLKGRRSVPLADLFARDLASGILKRLASEGEKRERYVLTYLPRSEKNLRKHGFDHGRLLCSRISRYSGIKEESFFVRHGGREHKKMGYEGRSHDAELTLDLAKSADVRGRRVILVDDVITTGATVNRAAELLYMNGADRVMCAVIARTAKKGKRK